MSIFDALKQRLNSPSLTTKDSMVVLVGGDPLIEKKLTDYLSDLKDKIKLVKTKRAIILFDNTSQLPEPEQAGEMKEKVFI